MYGYILKDKIDLTLLLFFVWKISYRLLSAWLNYFALGGMLPSHLNLATIPRLYQYMKSSPSVA